MNSSINNDRMEKHPLSFSFACGGWLKMYLFGVAKFLQEHELHKDAKLIGSSAGALAATGLGLNANFDDIKHHVVENIVPRAHANIFGAFRVRSYLIDTLEKHGNLDGFRNLNKSGQVTVVYTSLPSCKSKRLSSFGSSDCLKSALLASCCATPIAGLPFKREDEWVFDGGLIDFQPKFDKNTVTVSPFYCTNADIRPSRYVPMWWAVYPPCRENVQWVFDLGYEDAHAWAYRMGYVKTLPLEDSKATKLDGAWNSSFGRFIGYRSLENRVLDMIFVALIVLLWKPLAFTLMYAEVGFRAIFHAGKAAVFYAACQLLATLCIGGIFLSLSPLILEDGIFSMLSIAILGAVFVILVRSVGGKRCASETASRDWESCTTCLRSLASLSLLLHTIPIIGSAVPIKRHSFLMEHSIIYRLTNHFV